MTSTQIYRDIAVRTGGDIYIGVVGPVRTGKSTFIKRFMETVVIPAKGRFTQCVSTQVGCARGCGFCASGR